MVVDSGTFWPRHTWPVGLDPIWPARRAERCAAGLWPVTWAPGTGPCYGCSVTAGFGRAHPRLPCHEIPPTPKMICAPHEPSSVSVGLEAGTGDGAGPEHPRASPWEGGCRRALKSGEGGCRLGGLRGGVTETQGAQPSQLAWGLHGLSGLGLPAPPVTHGFATPQRRPGHQPRHPEWRAQHLPLQRPQWGTEPQRPCSHGHGDPSVRPALPRRRKTRAQQPRTTRAARERPAACPPRALSTPTAKGAGSAGAVPSAAGVHTRGRRFTPHGVHTGLCRPLSRSLSRSLQTSWP